MIVCFPLLRCSGPICSPLRKMRPVGLRTGKLQDLAKSSQSAAAIGTSSVIHSSCFAACPAAGGKLNQSVPSSSATPNPWESSFSLFTIPQSTCFLMHFLFPKRQDGWQPCSEKGKISCFMEEKKNPEMSHLSRICNPHPRAWVLSC